MTNHRAWQDAVAARSLLTTGEETRLAEHLRRCSECHALAEEYVRQDTFLHSLQAAQPMPNVRGAILEALATRPVPQRFRLRRFWPALVPLTMLAAVALVLVHSNRGTRTFSAGGDLPRVKKGLLALPTAAPTVAGIPAAPFIPPASAVRAVAVTHGLRITVATWHSRYPRNALVPVQVTIRNVGTDVVSVESGDSFTCTDFRPRLVVLDDRGNEVTPLPRTWRLIPSCPLVPPMAGHMLPPGTTQQVTLYAVLMARHIQAVLMLYRYHGCRPGSQACHPNVSAVRGRLLTLGLAPPDAPPASLQGTPPYALRMGRTHYSHGALWADGWYTCANRSGQTYEVGGIAPVTDKGSSAVLHLPTGQCAARHTTLHLVAGWPNHSVVFVNYGTR